MHGWVDQFGCHTSQFCLVVAIAMPRSLYRFLNLLKWTWFKDPNLNIYMMHKIILQYKKIVPSGHPNDFTVINGKYSIAISYNLLKDEVIWVVSS